jgi:hypothetical protein
MAKDGSLVEVLTIWPLVLLFSRVEKCLHLPSLGFYREELGKRKAA